jgi:ADP-ribose pyrophosphatase YjhB (NUDIX family)
MTEFNIA